MEVSRESSEAHLAALIAAPAATSEEGRKRGANDVG
jgi:hypothetical protein